MRILVTSDLHIDSTGPEPINRLVAGMDREHPDLVVIAGDAGTPYKLYEQCLSMFLKLDCPTAVIPGNGDLWCRPPINSADLLCNWLPRAARQCGFHWLEEEPLIFDNGIAVAGSIGWYDYSARDDSLNLSEDEIAANKQRLSLDGQYIDWPFTDVDFARRCRLKLQKQLMDLEEDPNVQQVLLVTHVPIFNCQIERRPEDSKWSKGTPYFAHITLGEAVRGFPKLRYVVSGHTHIGLHDVVERPGMNPIGAAVVGSDYGKPRWVTVEM